MTRRKEVTADETIVALLDELSESGEEIVLTKDGRTLATVTPVPGIAWQDDIVSSLNERWSAEEDDLDPHPDIE